MNNSKNPQIYEIASKVIFSCESNQFREKLQKKIFGKRTDITNQNNFKHFYGSSLNIVLKSMYYLMISKNMF